MFGREPRMLTVIEAAVLGKVRLGEVIRAIASGELPVVGWTERDNVKMVLEPDGSTRKIDVKVKGGPLVAEADVMKWAPSVTRPIDDEWTPYGSGAYHDRDLMIRRGVIVPTGPIQADTIIRVSNAEWEAREAKERKAAEKAAKAAKTTQQVR